MNSIEDAFEESKCFMPFIVAGYPNKDESMKIISSLIEAGADILEIGVPFSDPMADGSTIMEADQKALRNGFRVSDVFEIASEVDDVPIVLMAYANTLHSYGYQDFYDDAETSGVEGIIIPDMPPEEYKKELSELDSVIKTIFLVAENTPKERLEEVEALTEGFVYLVATKGTTGARKNFSKKAEDLIAKTSDFDIPRAIGFGISGPEQAKKAVESGANGVIMGSALIDAYEDEGLEEIGRLARETSRTVRGKN